MPVSCRNCHKVVSPRNGRCPVCGTDLKPQGTPIDTSLVDIYPTPAFGDSPVVYDPPADPSPSCDAGGGDSGGGGDGGGGGGGD